MENKKLGILLIIISIIFFIFLLYFSLQLSTKSSEIGCNPNEECKNIEDILSATHIGFGFFGFILALGFYLLFFNKTEQVILKKLEDDKNKKICDERFDLILKALDSYEQKVLRVVKEQDGITQNTLRLRIDMSKAKLSYVLQELEKRGIIKRIKKGKTLAIYLRV